MLEESEDKWPSVNLAYELVKSSYDRIQDSFDAVNNRIEFLLTFSSSVTLAAPIFVKALFNDIDFESSWFIAAIGIFVFTAIVGIIVYPSPIIVPAISGVLGHSGIMKR